MASVDGEEKRAREDSSESLSPSTFNENVERPAPLATAGPCEYPATLFYLKCSSECSSGVMIVLST